MRTLISTITLCLVVPITQAAEPPAQKEGLPLVWHEDFSEPGSLKQFEFTDTKAWKHDADEQALALIVKKSKYEPKVRSPHNIAWVKDLKVGSFVMEVEMKSTEKDYNHRDLCLFFGGVDPSNFYYVHLGKRPDPNAHNVFIVHDKPRKNIATMVDEGTDWDDEYHTVKLVRKDGGEIEVYYDGKLKMTAKDTTFPVGRVGVGSFDDTGNFRSITVWGEKK